MLMDQTIDATDEAILAARCASYNLKGSRPRLGDFVLFTCGTLRRISVLHQSGSMQAADVDSGSFYLGDGYAEFSGTCGPLLDPATLTDTGFTNDGRVWFFHHGIVRAGGRQWAEMPFRVFASNQVA